MHNQYFQYFRTPSSENPATTRSAAMLTPVLVVAGIASVVLGMVHEKIIMGAGIDWLILILFWATTILSWHLMQRGKVFTASLIFLLVTWLLITDRVAWYGGITSPLAAVNLVVIIIAGYLLGYPGGFLFSGLSILALLVFASGVWPGMEYTGFNDDSISDLYIQLCLVLIAAILQFFLARAIQRSDQQIHSRQDALEKSNSSLLFLRAELEKRVAERTIEIERQKLYYQALVNITPLATVTLDENHRILEINPAFTRLFGYRLEEISGRLLDEVVSNPTTLAEAQEYTRQVLNGHSIQGVGVRYTSDGSPRHVEILGVPIEMDGKRTGVLGLYHDIGERMAAEESRRLMETRYRQVVDHSPSPIFTVDPTGIIQTWNSACSSTFGYTEEIIGQNISKLLTTAEDCGIFNDLISRVLTGSSLSNIETRFLCADGSERRLITRIYPLFGPDRTIISCVFTNSDITEYVRMADALSVSESKFRSIVEQSQDGIALADAQGIITHWNHALERITGRLQQEVLGASLWDVITDLTPHLERPSSYKTDAETNWQVFISTGEAGWARRPIEHQIQRLDGGLVHLQSVVFPINSASGTSGAIFTRDVTEMALAEARLADFSKSFAAVLEGVNVGVFVSDMETGEILLVNRYIEQSFGDNVIGQNRSEVFFQNSEACAEVDAQSLLDDNGNPNEGIVWEEYNSMMERWFLYSDRAIHWHNGRLVRLEVAVDITDRKETEKQLEFKASHDSLTLLPNRTLFEDRLEHALAVARRTRQQVAVLFIDLDGFKWVNDTYGHATGDFVLCEFAKRLEGCLREGDSVARVGGDEFTVALEHITSIMQTELVAHRILEAISRPFLVKNKKEVYLSASIGISLFPEHGGTVNELIRSADVAMYSAKELGKATFYIAGGSGTQPIDPNSILPARRGSQI